MKKIMENWRNIQTKILNEGTFGYENEPDVPDLLGGGAPAEEDLPFVDDMDVAEVPPPRPGAPGRGDYEKTAVTKILDQFANNAVLKSATNTISNNPQLRKGLLKALLSLPVFSKVTGNDKRDAMGDFVRPTTPGSVPLNPQTFGESKTKVKGDKLMKISRKRLEEIIKEELLGEEFEEGETFLGSPRKQRPPIETKPYKSHDFNMLDSELQSILGDDMKEKPEYQDILTKLGIDSKEAASIMSHTLLDPMFQGDPEPSAEGYALRLLSSLVGISEGILMTIGEAGVDARDRVLNRLSSQFQDDLRNQREVNPELKRGHGKGSLEKAELGVVEGAERALADRVSSSLYEGAAKRKGIKRIKRRIKKKS